MTTKNEYIPQTVTHPGVTLDAKIKEMQMSVKEFAARMHKSEESIIAVINGDSAITPDMAAGFEAVTRIPADFWMTRQRKYDEALATTAFSSSTNNSMTSSKALCLSDRGVG
jgi:addiction module HigA family antidote